MEWIQDRSTGLQKVPAVGYGALDTYLPRDLGVTPDLCGL